MQARSAHICARTDLPPAAPVLDAGAHPITPRGRVFDAESIGDALASRDLMTTLRSFSADGEGPRGGPPPMGKGDRSEFLNRLDALVHAIKRAGR